MVFSIMKTAWGSAGALVTGRDRSPGLVAIDGNCGWREKVVKGRK